MTGDLVLMGFSRLVPVVDDQSNIETYTEPFTEE